MAVQALWAALRVDHSLFRDRKEVSKDIRLLIHPSRLLARPLHDSVQRPVSVLVLELRPVQAVRRPPPVPVLQPVRDSHRPRSHVSIRVSHHSEEVRRQRVVARVHTLTRCIRFMQTATSAISQPVTNRRSSSPVPVVVLHRTTNHVVWLLTVPSLPVRMREVLK